ncbi:gamma-aminobutyric acid receptor subunit alpha-2-like [Tigriopus californicus]|uniref:gamma-aminobutyric acid receptor subunit alpha-2-like n=1 Tax=Tigriopus californicus TaxID=6832 RepID=UPI0027D9FFE5|nr:gamma-aminobutyric acid receptor subunit alpha-2-like [Tigriopus californicus]
MAKRYFLVLHWYILGTLGDLQEVLRRECFLRPPTNYSKSLPAKISNEKGQREPLEVFFTFGGSEIEYIKEENQRIYMSIVYEEKWSDPRIFDLEENKGCWGKVPLKYLRDNFWTPALVHWNARKHSSINTMMDDNLGYALVTPDNYLIYSVALTVEVNCKFQFDQFPFDHHDCPYLVTNWFDTTDYVVLKGNMVNQTKGKELWVETTQVYEVEVTLLEDSVRFDGFSTPPRNLSVTGKNYHFRRMLFPYITTFFAPMVIVVYLSMISFWIPVEIVPGRMSMLVTLFLTSVNLGISNQANAPPSNKVGAVDLWNFIIFGTHNGIIWEYAYLLFSRFKFCKANKGIANDSKYSEAMREFTLWTNRVDTISFWICFITFPFLLIVYFSLNIK